MVNVTIPSPEDHRIAKRPKPKADSRGERRKREILETALVMFSEQGYDGVSLRELAQRVGVDHSLVKYHFTDMDTLWREAVRFLFERMHKELEPFRRLDGAKELRIAFPAFIREMVAYHARHPEHARLMVMESVRESERLKWAAETFIRRQHRSVAPWLQKVIAEGLLPDVPIHELVTIINAMCHISVTLAPMVRLSWGVESPEGDAIGAHAETVLKILGFPATS